jgi:hypothetical protein
MPLWSSSCNATSLSRLPCAVPTGCEQVPSPTLSARRPRRLPLEARPITRNWEQIQIVLPSQISIPRVAPIDQVAINTGLALRPSSGTPTACSKTALRASARGFRDSLSGSYATNPILVTRFRHDPPIPTVQILSASACILVGVYFPGVPGNEGDQSSHLSVEENVGFQTQLIAIRPSLSRPTVQQESDCSHRNCSRKLYLERRRTERSGRRFVLTLSDTGDVFN